MFFQIENTIGTVSFQGQTYALGSYIPIESCIGFGGVKYTMNAIDGPNAGRALDGHMIRDMIAIKGRWDVQLTGIIKSVDAQVILSLVKPESFHIKTDLPTGTLDMYECYTNNIPVQFALKKPDGTEYYSGVTIPIVEV